MERSEDNDCLLQLDVNSLSGDHLAKLEVKSSSSVARVEALLEQIAPPPRKTRYRLLFEDGVKTGDSELQRFLPPGQMSCSLTACVEAIPFRFHESADDGQEKTSIKLIKRLGAGQEIAFQREDGVQDKTSIKRLEGQGVVALSIDPIPVIDGVPVFEVVINEVDQSGSLEGVEIGITHNPREGLRMHPGYAVLTRPSWVSSDAGCLWIHGQKQYELDAWLETTPTELKAGDVVRLTVLPEGGLQIDVNGRMQAKWTAGSQLEREADWPSTTQPLYALVGLRAPCLAVTAQLPC